MGALIDVAELFLSWLERHGQELSSARQGDLDQWHTENLVHNSTATNPSSRYLLPGRRAGQPIKPYTLYPAIREGCGSFAVSCDQATSW
jgi:hypothetical protein